MLNSLEIVHLVTMYSSFRMRKAFSFSEAYSSQCKSTDFVPSTFIQQIPLTPQAAPQPSTSTITRSAHHWYCLPPALVVARSARHWLCPSVALPFTSSAQNSRGAVLLRHLSSEICLCWIILHEHRGYLFRSSLRDHIRTTAPDQREVKQSQWGEPGFR